MKGLNGIDVLLLMVIVFVAVQASRWKAELDTYRNKDKDIYVPNQEEIDVAKERWWKP